MTAGLAGWSIEHFLNEQATSKILESTQVAAGLGRYRQVWVGGSAMSKVPEVYLLAEGLSNSRQV